MPTRPGFDVIPLRRATKERLEALKGDASYDAVLQSLLAEADRPPATPLGRERDPQEQLALAELAARRWELARRRGQIQELGPRLIVYRTGMNERRPASERSTRFA